MKDFICIPHKSEIFREYLLLLINFFKGDYDFIIYFLTNHSFISAIYQGFSFINLEYTNLFEYLLLLIMFIVIGIIIDFLFYFLGKYFSKFIKFKYENKNLFYIFFRFLPIIGIFSCFFGSLLSKKFEIKKDLLKIIIGNFIFSILNIIFWIILYRFCGSFLG